MTRDQFVVDMVKGILLGARGGINPPYRVTLPRGMDPDEHWEGENVTLRQRVMDLSDDIKEVVRGDTSGLSVETIREGTHK